MTLAKSIVLTALLLGPTGATVGCATPHVVAATAPMASSQICVVRHAEAYKNLDPRPTDLTPAQLDSLTPRGEAQANGLCSTLPDRVVLVWSSPTQRTRQTAALLGACVDVAIEVEVVTDLRSLDGGVAWNQRMSAWSRGHDPRPDDGESLADGQRRTQALLTRLRARLAPGEHVVVVTHGDIASLLLGELRGTPLLERPVHDTLVTGEARCVPISDVTSEGAP